MPAKKSSASEAAATRSRPPAAPLTVPPRTGHKTFLYSELCTDLDNLKADIAFLGIPYGSPYSFEDFNNNQAQMPTAMRAATRKILRDLDRYDFDVGGPLYDGRPIRAVDCGDVPGDILDIKSHHTTRAEQAVHKIIKAGAMPIIIGGDHAIPIPVLRAMESHPSLKDGPITLVHIDQHLDWRDHVNGVHDGLSSPIRRASEMKHIDQIFQIGIRATGSARPEEVAAAKAYGAHIITSWELHDVGMDAILKRIPDGGRYYITVDLDGMDVGEAPAVGMPMPGGVTYMQARKMIHGLVRKGRVIGMDVVEITPEHDVNQITCVTAGRLIVNLIGTAVRAGYFGK